VIPSSLTVNLERPRSHGEEAEFNRTKTLLQLKREKFGPYWDFQSFPSRFYLRNVPLEQLSDTDLWVLIRQSIGLDYVVVVALERLELNPLLKCGHGEGDLLSAVLRADALVWKRNPTHRQRVKKLWGRISARLLARQSPEVRMLFGDYRWFLKTENFLPED
jgi:hypothetical protein